MRTRTGIAAIALMVLAGCARSGGPGGPAADPDPVLDASLVSEDYTGRFRTDVGVLESAEHGPQLCYEVQDSYPPQCEGPDVVGWDWSAVEAESASGTTWGNYRITGTWDGSTFTLTEAAVTDTGTSHPVADYDFSAPCPEPAGGWAAFPADLAADPPAYEAALAAVHDLPELAGTWVDQGGTAADPAPVPEQFILVVRTTGDVATMEAAARAVWPGALCVVGGARYTEDEGRAMEEELRSEPGALGAAVDVIDDDVEITVYVASEERQRDLDDRFGVRTVRQLGVFKPLD